MPCPNSARERSVTIGFRVTPEQARRIDLMARASGMTKQDYLYKRALEEEVVVRPDVRVYKMLRDEMARVYRELRRIRCSPGRSTSSRGSSPPCAARRSPRTSSGRTPSSSGCLGGEDAFPAPVDASASAARRPSVPRLWSPSDGWPALPERFPRSPQSGILQSL